MLTAALDEFGEESAEYATVLNNLAMLLKAKGDLDAAEPLSRKAIAIAEKSLGVGHPTTTALKANLTQLLTGKH